MRGDIDKALNNGGGALGRRALAQLLGREALDSEIRRGNLIRLAPRVYGRPWSADDPDVADIAAIRYGSPNALLSHRSALRRFGLAEGPVDQRHITVGLNRRLRGIDVPGRPGLVVHRDPRQLARDLSTRVPCVTPAVALVSSWPGAAGADQRASIIKAVQQRQVTPEALKTELAQKSQLPDRAALADLIGLLEVGCESELEIWGYRSVFTIAELAGGVWQYAITTRRGSYRFDLAYPHARLAIELDGRRYHASTDRWERDIARDVAVATEDWQTLRFSHARLTREVAGVQRDVLSVLRHRERRFI